ncbi:MAG: glycosyltransferase [Ktedonobacterales bacterium]
MTHPRARFSTQEAPPAQPQQAIAHARTPLAQTLQTPQQLGVSPEIAATQALQGPPTLSLIAPACSAEGEQVAALARRVALALGAASEKAVSYELIVVDDSDDDTPALTQQAVAADPHLRLIHRNGVEHGGGLATAVVAGMRAARGAWIGVIDADHQHPPELLPELLATAQESEADIVVASRSLAADGPGLASHYRRIVSRASAVVVATLFDRVRLCSDPLSGYFLLRRDVIDGVELRPVGSNILLEVLARGRWQRLAEVSCDVPSQVAGRAAGVSKASVTQGLTYGRHLAALRFTGKRGRGPARLVGPSVKPPDPDDPLPLDDELPQQRATDAGPQRRRYLWTIVLLALAFRVLLLPIGHWWDLTIDYNTFMDLARNISPYDTMRALSGIARSAGWDTAYEYYAYPPVPLYIYWPLAHLYQWLHPHASYFIAVSGSTATPVLPWDFYFWLKLPIWLADFGIAALLARMTGTARAWRDYLLNPYVLLVSGAWTFDAVMVVALVAGVLWLQQGKLGRAGLALAVGTMVKFLPALAVPTLILYLIKRQRPLREIVLFVGAYLIGCIALLGPFANGLGYVLTFHSGRVGGGMNWENIWTLWRLFPTVNLPPIQLAIGAFGTPMLVITLLLAYWYVYVNEQMSLNRMLLVTFLAFMVGSKLVNEQYALTLLPFLYIEMRRLGGAWRWFYRLLWAVPLAFAAMRVPLDHFLLLFYHSLFKQHADIINVTGVTGFESSFVPWNNMRIQPWSVALLCVAFWALCLLVILWPVRPWRAHYALMGPSGQAGAAISGSGAHHPDNPDASDDQPLAPLTRAGDEDAQGKDDPLRRLWRIPPGRHRAAPRIPQLVRFAPLDRLRAGWRQLNALLTSVLPR